MKLKNVLMLMLASLSLFSCKTETLAQHVDEENEAIDKYFNNIDAVIVTEKPEQVPGEWLDSNGRKIYYRPTPGLYYHQISLGDTTAPDPKSASTVYVRYQVTDLKGQLIYSTSEKNSPNPISFMVGESSSIYGEGFQQSVMYLKKGGVCESVVSFKLKNTYSSSIEGGYSSSELEYLPMLYNIRLVNVE